MNTMDRREIEVAEPGERTMKFEESEGTLRCRFEKELNSDVCSRIEGPLAERIEDGLKTDPELSLVFDLADVRYISSAFLRLCLYHCKRVGLNRFRIENCSEDIRKVYSIAGFTEMMQID